VYGKPNDKLETKENSRRAVEAENNKESAAVLQKQPQQLPQTELSAARHDASVVRLSVELKLDATHLPAKYILILGFSMREIAFRRMFE
jgi:hypothetical protein